MAIYKNKDLEVDISFGTSKQINKSASFYTGDKGSASIRITVKHKGFPFNFAESDMIPTLDLIHSDGSIWLSEPMTVVDGGTIQYNIPNNIIEHAGTISAKLFLKNADTSIHVLNFNIEILDSGVEGAVEKEVSVNIVDDAVKRIIEANPESFKGNDADPNDVKVLLEPYVDEKTNQEFEKLSSAKQVDSEIIYARQSSDNLKERLNNSNYLPNKNDVNRSIISKSTTNKPMVTFIDDDGRSEVLQKWEPILQEKGNKLTVAVVGSWVDSEATTVMQWDTIHRLNREYGVEFVNHTLEHKHALQITDEEVDHEFRENKKILQREGLAHDIIVQPFGENTDSVRRISRNYAKANVSTKEGINTLPLDTFRLFRITLGEDVYTTWEQYKAILDDAISKNAWVIFKSHSQYESFNENQLQLIRQIIDYCRANDFIEASMEEGLEDRGNLIDVGDYTLKAQGSDYYILDKEGNIYSKKYDKNYYTLKYNSVTIDTPITDFEDRTTSTVAIVSSNTKGFPNNASGQLVTTKSESLSLSYQLYMVNNSNDIYKRRWDTKTNSWTEFEKITGASGATSKLTISKREPVNVEVPANSYKDVNITVDGINNFDNVVVTPGSGIEIGLIYNGFISSENTVRIRFWNMTNNAVTTNRPYKIDIIKNR